MDLPLIAAKIRVPRRQPVWLPRSELVQRLQTGRAQGASLFLVSAPAGFGKTTLTSCWLNDPASGVEPQRIAWYALDAGDNDPNLFFLYLITALQGLNPGLGADLFPLLHAPQPVPPQVILSGLLNELEAETKPFVLVLDDYHVITQPLIHQGLQLMVEHLPPAMSLVLTTRSDPPLPLSRLRARGQLMELRAADLRFGIEETTAFFSQRAGVTLNPQEIGQIQNRVEGWAAGLQMAALALRALIQNGGSVELFLQNLSGEHRFILDYLMEEVFNRQPPEVQTFWLHTAILERLNAACCDELLAGQPIAGRSQALLEQLERDNLFLVALDDERGWYRYHHLFADLLRARQKQILPEKIVELHRRAAAWFEKNHLLSEAISHAFSAADLPLAIQIIEKHVSELFFLGEWTTVLGWLKVLPEEVIQQRPWLCTLKAIGLQQTGVTQDVPAWLDQAEKNAAADPDPFLIPLILTSRVMLADMAGDAQRVIDLASPLVASLPPSAPGIQVPLLSMLGHAYFTCGEIERATQYFTQAEAATSQAPDLYGRLMPRALLARAYKAAGQLPAAGACYQRAQEAALAAGRPEAMGMNNILIGWGDLLREQNELALAHQLIERGLRICRRHALLNLEEWGLVNLARVLIPEGELSAAANALQKASEIRRRFPIYPENEVTFAACQVRLWLALNQADEIRAWLESPAQQELLSPQKDFSALNLLDTDRCLVLARALNGLKQPARALALLDALEASPVLRRYCAGQIEATLQRAAALWALGQSAAALSAFEKALSLTAAGGYVRAYLDLGQPALDMLHAGHGHPGFPQAQIHTLLAAFGEPQPQAAPAAAPLPETLTERELEVLRLLAQGFSNERIAQHLVVALGTVKTHTANIYRKLEAANRTQAVARARQLGLIRE